MDAAVADIADRDLTPSENGMLAVKLEERYLGSVERQASLRLAKAVRLAPDLLTCEALLRGERVPRSRLDPDWLRAYGL